MFYSNTANTAVLHKHGAYPRGLLDWLTLKWLHSKWIAEKNKKGKDWIGYSKTEVLKSETAKSWICINQRRGTVEPLDCNGPGVLIITLILINKIDWFQIRKKGPAWLPMVKIPFTITHFFPLQMTNMSELHELNRGVPIHQSLNSACSHSNHYTTLPVAAQG